MTTAYVPEPMLEMRDETPVSLAFGDVYFSRAGGVAETEHVFLAANGLPQRWQAAEDKAFSIGELGFGTGLNFLVTLQHFRAHAPAGATLHYHAVEKFPFRPEVLATLLAELPELAVEELLTHYPLRLPGPHRMVMDRVVLNLWFGEVTEWLDALPDHAIDAWYLDGFAPAKNPDMWREEIFVQMARASARAASFATFTAASAVRRGLEAAGFVVEKVPGFGKKREMLKGVASKKKADVSRRPTHLLETGDWRLATPCLIIGAGIAGASLAQALAQRGHLVTVLERGVAASGASGNAAGVLFPPLTKQWTPQTEFYFTAYDLMLRQIARWQGAGLHFATGTPGMLRLPRHAEEEAQLMQLQATLGIDPSIVHWLDRQAASAKAGVALPSGAAWFPQGSWLSPRALCEALLQHPRIMRREYTEVSAIARETALWRVMCEDGASFEAPILCVAAAVDTAKLLPEHGLRLQPVGGQVSEFTAQDAAAPLSSILCRKGYVIPCGEHYLTGATYHREALLEVTEARHEENLREVQATIPGWFNGQLEGGRSAIRATTPGRKPYIGKLAEGLYVSTGHGSRGLLSAPLAAEMITSMIHQEPLPVSLQVREWLEKALHSQR